jgi:hypothetical protein
MKSIYTQFLIALLFIACNQKKATEIDPQDVPTYLLTSKKFNSSVILNPRRLFEKNDVLLVIEDYRMPPNLPLIHIFKKEPLTYLHSKGQRGVGPLEAQSVEVLQYSSSDSTFLMYSGMDRKFIEYSLYDSSKLGIREFKIPDFEVPLGTFFMRPDSIFVGIPTYAPNKIVEADFHGKKRAAYGAWEQVEGKKEMSDFHHYNLNQGWFKTNEAFTIFVNACIYRDRLEIFNVETKALKVVDWPSQELPEFNFYGPTMPLDIPMTNPFRYRDVVITNDRIYALYGGISHVEHKKTGELAKKIIVFTLTGKPLLIFELDRSISSLVVEEGSNSIYGLTTDENPGIAMFKIPAKLF